jgi:DNA-binding CsgD family transcriptional regulator
VLINLGELYRDMGDLERSGGYLAEARRIFEQIGGKRGIGAVDLHSAVLSERQGEPRRGVQQAANAASLLWDIGDVRLVAEAFEVLGGLALDLGETERATRFLGAADGVRAPLGGKELPEDIAHRQALRERAKQAVATEAFEQGYAAGRALDGAAVVAEAKSLAERVSVVCEEIGAASKQAGLTPREEQVLTRIAAGDGYQAIAGRFGITVPQVSAMVGSLYTKLGVDSHAALTAFAFKSGLV